MSLEKFLKGKRFRNIHHENKVRKYYASPLTSNSGMIELSGNEHSNLSAMYAINDDGTITVTVDSPFGYQTGVLNPETDLEFEPEEVTS